MRSFVMMNIISKIFRQDFQYGTDATSKHFKNQEHLILRFDQHIDLGHNKVHQLQITGTASLSNQKKRLPFHL